MRHALVWVFLFSLILAMCGDQICTADEESSCSDCSMIVSNYVCNSYLTQYDPDCTNTNGCYGPDTSWFLYDNGRGTNCWPGRCEAGICNTSCTVQSDCTSQFCIQGACSTVCATGTISASYGVSCCYNHNATAGACETFENPSKSCSSGEWEVWPVSSGIFTGDSLSIGFKIIHYCNSNKTADLLATGPCELSYYSSISFYGPGSETVYIKLSECKLTGAGSIKLSVSDSSDSVNASAYFLSYPSILYRYGEEPRRGAGESMFASLLNNIPVEVRAWIG
ncbi:MAG: hypothetical protein GOU99_02605 [Candidatus Altiarchaeota archaeon]|nr:hypothetical protein [Candidatus Altiarchaeota archaeon]